MWSGFTGWRSGVMNRDTDPSGRLQNISQWSTIATTTTTTATAATTTTATAAATTTATTTTTTATTTTTISQLPN